MRIIEHLVLDSGDARRRCGSESNTSKGWAQDAYHTRFVSQLIFEVITINANSVIY